MLAKATLASYAQVSTLSSRQPASRLPGCWRHHRSKPHPFRGQMLPRYHAACTSRESDAWAEALSGPATATAGDHLQTDAALLAADNLPSLARGHAHCSAWEQEAWAQALSATEARAEAAVSAPQPSLPPAQGAASDRCQPGVRGVPPLLVVVECGSHSTRALICRPDGTELARLGYDTHLSSGLVRGDDLQPQAVQRCVQALEAIHDEVCSLYPQEISNNGGFQHAAATTGSANTDGWHAGADGSECMGDTKEWARGAGGVTAMGTMALRQCANPQAVGDHIQRLFGVPLQVLPGEEEGRLCYLGATGRIQEQTRQQGSGAQVGTTSSSPSCLVVVDMGGMSTELTWQEPGGSDLNMVSFTLGCVELTATLFEQDASSSSADASGIAGAAQACMKHVQRMLDDTGGDALRELVDTAMAGSTQADSPGPRIEAVLTGGTATTAAALLLALPAYDAAAINAARVSQGQLLGLASLLLGQGSEQLQAETELQAQAAAVREMLLGSAAAAACSPAEGQRLLKQRFDWLTEARARTLAAGACALAAVLQWLGVRYARVSDADLLDGAMQALVQDLAIRDSRIS